MSKNLKICYYLAAIGDPYIEEKLNILEHNLYILSKNKDIVVDLAYNLYSFENKEDNITTDRIKHLLNNIYSYKEKGILAELWLKNPITFENYDYIIFILDDVKLSDNFDIETIIQLKIKHNLNIISPSIINSSHSYMNTHPEDKFFSITGEIELYCYILSPNDWEKYKSTLYIENPWTWGNNSILRFHNISLGIDYNSAANHVFRFPSDTSKHMEGLQKLMRHNGFDNEYDFCQKCPNFREYM